ncbi:MAG: sugar transferase [Floccifex sp.]
MKKKTKKALVITGLSLTAAYTGLSILAKHSRAKQEQDPDLKEQQYENAGIRISTKEKTFYEKYGKRAIDVCLSFGGLIVLAPVYGLISLAIVVDDPGPVLFTQKRVGENKTYFMLHKFRSMKMSTPHDVPTHMLENPDQYITRVGKFLRKYSLDELPQIWDIFVGNITTVGPRPALWNQKDLIAQRDLYTANDVKPGLTGWAQVNGRDELEIDVKASLDGEYTRALQKNSISGLCMDIKCFFKTISSVLAHDGVVEGGTGTLSSQYDQIGFGQEVKVNFKKKRKVLITGKDSYIGTSFEKYAYKKYQENFEIDTLDMKKPDWKDCDFSKYDTIFHVAGIAHADIDHISEEEKKLYYDINCDLALECAKKAKNEDVKQFIFMSSMIVYGQNSSCKEKVFITRTTKPSPSNFYGDSKWQADQKIRSLMDKKFQVVTIRPPMIYGKGSKGNYPLLAKLAQKSFILPEFDNQRSILYIDNLCELVAQIILVQKGGIFFPQNKEYVSTTQIMEQVAKVHNHKVIVSKTLKPSVFLSSLVPGKVGKLVNKAFGNCVYDKALSIYPGLDYQVVDFESSIQLTEGK